MSSPPSVGRSPAEAGEWLWLTAGKRTLCNITDSLEKSNSYKNMSFMQQEEIKGVKGFIHISQLKGKPTLK